MNYHSDNWIMSQIERHYKEALKIYDKQNIIGIFCQGSQNYGLDIENSDIDTKCILTPIFKDICLDKKSVSTTHILNNNEHLDAKDVRSYMTCFRKQNLNFLEILFTPYFIINPLYHEEWNKLVIHREQIARMNPYRAIQSMKGIALEKYFAMEHRYPSRAHVLDKFGYDVKQLHHLARVHEWMIRFHKGERYEDCLISKDPIYLLSLKLGAFSLEEAREKAEYHKQGVEEIAEVAYNTYENKENEETRQLLEEVSYNIMRISVMEELKECIVR